MNLVNEFQMYLPQPSVMFASSNVLLLYFVIIPIEFAFDFFFSSFFKYLLGFRSENSY